MTIKQILDDLIVREGGYVNDPKDSGGETKYGWTRKALREMGWFGAVKDLDKQAAFDLYYRRFITLSGYKQIIDISEAVGEELVDTAVNMGEVWAGKFLQWSLNALNNEAKMYPDIVDDGVVGPATARTFKRYMVLRGAEGEVVMLRALNCFQGARYMELAQKYPKNERFAYGWLRSRVVI